MSNIKVDCLIPFYNESTRIEKVIKAALQSKVIGKIICIDDGSIDNFKFCSDILNSKNFKLLAHRTNKGKTEAIITGLSAVKSKYVFLLDADLIGLTADMITKIVSHTVAHDLDMMILRRINTLPITKLLKMDILEAGERILKTDDLRKILSHKLVGYELEPAINAYFVDKKYRIAYTTQPVEQYRKIDKVGLLPGLIGDLKALIQILKFTGFKRMYTLIREFNPEEITL